MGVNRVNYAGETIIDISDSTVAENNLLAGARAYGANGEPINGAVITHDVIDNLNSTSSNDALSANQGRVLNEKIEGITVPTKLSDLDDDATHRLVTDSEKTAWNNKSDFDGNYNSLSNKPTIPSSLSELTEDATHRTVTDEEKTKWNESGGGSSVSWNQIVTSGTKIAEVSVDGNKTDVYAPNGGSGGGGTASDITYDNSTSGMTATNVQDAIDEQKQDLTQKVDKEWKFVGQTVGASNISLPQDFNELNIVLYISGLGNQKLQVTRNELTESDATYRQGWNYGGANQLIGISVNLTRVRLGICYIDNVDKISQTTVKVWYR